MVSWEWFQHASGEGEGGGSVGRQKRGGGEERNVTYIEKGNGE